MNHPPQHHQQRRTFRGRAGANDRRLPKQNAARRQPCRPNEQSDSEPLEKEASIDVHIHSHLDVTAIGEDENSYEAEVVEIPPVEQSIEKVKSAAPLPHVQEIAHLHKRIRNNRESMSLSSSAFANPKTYQSNVLGACLNTVKEYKSILRQYEGDNIDDQTHKKLSLSIFELIQQSLQTGPLAGGKPGYFKRCGSEVATMVLNFLQQIISATSSHDRDVPILQHWTSKQCGAIESWICNAQAATDSDAPPSKSNLKKQQGQTKRKKKR